MNTYHALRLAIESLEADALRQPEGHFDRRAEANRAAAVLAREAARLAPLPDPVDATRLGVAALRRSDSAAAAAHFRDAGRIHAIRVAAECIDRELLEGRTTAADADQIRAAVLDRL